MEIDIDFNFKSDTPPNKDPDSFSPTLRKYHKVLWSKQLPSGAMMIFPSNRINGKNTINGDRGFNSKIRDRFDLTLECIRRYYCHENSPLSETLSRYSDFFALFENFEGYVDYFLLQDLISQDYTKINFFTSFDNFNSNIIPKTVEDYQSYRELSICFIKDRSSRIKTFSQTNLEYRLTSG